MISEMDLKEKKLRETIEETGKVFEKFDLTPMQGRIIAYFTLSDPPEKTFEELVRFFYASKSSISNSLNFLLQTKIIDYKTFSSDRKRYFFITDQFFRIYFSRVLENVRELKSHAYRTVTLRSPEHRAVSERIIKWIENANVFEQKLGETISATENEF
jgi:DNA-binding transcriptional regulator GbsR (MarR family)